ncbi:MAG: hypothetical protein RLZ12_810 [Bacillota bacterium]
MAAEVLVAVEPVEIFKIGTYNNAVHSQEVFAADSSVVSLHDPKVQARVLTLYYPDEAKSGREEYLNFLEELGSAYFDQGNDSYTKAVIEVKDYIEAHPEAWPYISAP